MVLKLPNANLDPFSHLTTGNKTIYSREKIRQSAMFHATSTYSKGALHPDSVSTILGFIEQGVPL